MEIVEGLEATKTATLEYYDLGHLAIKKTYGPGKWTIRYILHHLSDAETVFYDRVRRCISEPRQIFLRFDERAWAVGMDYASFPLELSRNIYLALREGVVYQARRHY